jgi:hypothetical protein
MTDTTQDDRQAELDLYEARYGKYVQERGRFGMVSMKVGVQSFPIFWEDDPERTLEQNDWDRKWFKRMLCCAIHHLVTEQTIDAKLAQQDDDFHPATAGDDPIWLGGVEYITKSRSDDLVQAAVAAALREAAGIADRMDGPDEYFAKLNWLHVKRMVAVCRRDILALIRKGGE